MANLLTAIRLLLALPLAWSMAEPTFLPGLVILAILIIAVVTDYFDGIVARARGTASPKGMLFDHGTDFLFVTSSLAGAASVGSVHWLLPALIVIAFGQYVLDSYLLFRQKELRMNFLGRWNGIFYFVPLFGVALSRSIPLDSISILLAQTTYFLSLLLIVSTCASVFDRGLAPFRKTQ